MTYFRGSLRQCIVKCFDRFDAKHDELLAIVVNPAGKYYTILAVSDLTKKHSAQDGGHQRLVFYGTRRELLTFTQSTTHDLFEERPTDET